MKKLLLLCSLISSANAVPASLLSKQILNDMLLISVVCIGTTEYVVATQGTGTAITPALDKNGKPIQCSVN